MYRSGKTNRYVATVFESEMTLQTATIEDLKVKVDSLLADEEYQLYVRLKSKFSKPEVE